MPEIEIESLLLRVYCLVSDKAGHSSLHQAIVEAARRGGLAGASVMKGKMGFGRNSFYSDLLTEVFSDQQPVVVEIVDQPDRITSFMSVLHDLVKGRRLITLERAEVIYYQPHDVSNDG